MRVQTGFDRIAATPPPVVIEQPPSRGWNPLRRPTGPECSRVSKGHHGQTSSEQHTVQATALRLDEDDFLNRLRCAGL